MISLLSVSFAMWSQMAVGIQFARTQETCPKTDGCARPGTLFGIGDNSAKVITKDPFSGVYFGRQMQETNVLQVAAGEKFQVVLQRDNILEFKGKIVSRKWINDDQVTGSVKVQGSIGDVRRAYAGTNFMYFQLMNGSWMSAGDNSEGQLGLGYSGGVEVTPRVVEDLEGLDISQVSLGFHMVAFVLSNGSALAVGDNGNGQMGLNDYENRLRITLLPVDNIASATAGIDNLYLVTRTGFVGVAGSNGWGELCLDSDESAVKKFEWIFLHGQTIVAVAAAPFKALFLTDSGDVYMCGIKPETGVYPYYDGISKIEDLSNVRHITASATFDVAVSCDGTVKVRGGAIGKQLQEEDAKRKKRRWAIVPGLENVACAVSGPLSQQAYFITD